MSYQGANTARGFPEWLKGPMCKIDCPNSRQLTLACERKYRLRNLTPLLRLSLHYALVSPFVLTLSVYMEAAAMAPSRDLPQQKLVCPRARKCRPEPSQTEQWQRSKLTSSFQAMGTSGEHLGELELILQGQPPDPSNTFLGVSPPVRSGFYGGAANPIQHDSTWSACALNASHSNLQALRELDSQQSFLRCTGDYRLLLGSPDMRSLVEEVAERSSQPQGQPQQEPRHLLPFTCRAQYFAVR